jgi:hypothetical protein
MQQYCGKTLDNSVRWEKAPANLGHSQMGSCVDVKGVATTPTFFASPSMIEVCTLKNPIFLSRVTVYFFFM